MSSFIEEYWSKKLFKKLYWRGIPCWKLAFDLFIYQELIVNLRPDYIIETGTYKGGTSLFMADICELVGHGEVITIDNNPQVESDLVLQNKRIHFFVGESINESILNKINDSVSNSNCMVILDSIHHKDYVRKEMDAYKGFVKPGFHLIVEDGYLGSIVQDAAVPLNCGPISAIQDFMTDNIDFIIDRELCNRHLVTFNPEGYLRRW